MKPEKLECEAPNVRGYNCWHFAQKNPLSVRLSQHAKQLYLDLGGGNLTRGLELSVRRVGIYCQGVGENSGINYQTARKSVLYMIERAGGKVTVDEMISAYLADGSSVPALLICIGQMLDEREVIFNSNNELRRIK